MSRSNITEYRCGSYRKNAVFAECDGRRYPGMLACTMISPGDKVLDLGCGYGVVGIYAAKLPSVGERITMAVR